MATYSSSLRAAETGQDQPYALVSITHTASPMKSEEADWYQYVIKQGKNEIVGYRRGTPEGVRVDIDLIVDQLNSRRGAKSGGKRGASGPTK